MGKKICLSVSAHHPESWQPAWGIRTIITALVGFFPSKAEGALAGLDYTDEERRELAARSATYQCPVCGARMSDVALDSTHRSASATAIHVPAELRFSAEASSGKGALASDPAEADAGADVPTSAAAPSGAASSADTTGSAAPGSVAPAATAALVQIVSSVEGVERVEGVEGVEGVVWCSLAITLFQRLFFSDKTFT